MEARGRRFDELEGLEVLAMHQRNPRTKALDQANGPRRLGI